MKGIVRWFLDWLKRGKEYLGVLLRWLCISICIGAVCGVDRGYGLTMSLLMNMVLNLGLAVLDLIAILRAGLTGLYFTLLLRCIVCGVAAFGAVGLGIRFLRKYVEDHDYSVFSYYCWGLALFTFILNLMA